MRHLFGMNATHEQGKNAPSFVEIHYICNMKEVIETMKKVTNTNFQVDITSRRIGDPAALISNNTKIKTKMNWIPKYDDLALICKSAFEWKNKMIGEKK